MKILLLGIIVLLMFGCNLKNNEAVVHDENIIDIENVFLQKEESYYVLFYLDSCLSCRNVKVFFIKKKPSLNHNLYYIDVKNADFMVDFDKSNVELKNYLDIKIHFVPTLFIIENKMVKEEIIGQKEITHYQNYF